MQKSIIVASSTLLITGALLFIFAVPAFSQTGTTTDVTLTLKIPNTIVTDVLNVLGVAYGYETASTSLTKVQYVKAGINQRCFETIKQDYTNQKQQTAWEELQAQMIAEQETASTEFNAVTVE